MPELEIVCEVSKGRALVQAAYGDKPGPVGSVMELFSGKGKNQKESSLKPSSKSEGFSPTRIHASETRKQGKSREPNSSGSSGGRVLKAIASLPPDEQAWVRHCYNPSRAGKSELAEQLFRHIWDRYHREHLTNRNRTTQSSVRALLATQLYQCTSFAALEGWDTSRPLEVRAYTDIDGDTWRRKYRAHWKNIHYFIVEMDRSAMRHVYEICIY